ncbi:MAG: DUF1190 domain-containing protein [Hyphomicrobiales bacterium]
MSMSMTMAAILVAAVQTDAAGARTRRPAPLPAAAASAIYADERDCTAKGALEASECRNAALNTRAEYQEKAPRFDANEACTRVFGAHNCAMRIGGAPGGIGFVPSYKGFTLLRGKGEAGMTALPVLAGANGGVAFAPRPVTRPDTQQDAARGARAQAIWQNAHAPVIRSAGGALRYREAPKGAMPDLSDDAGEAQSGPAATYPVSPAMLKAMQDEMRKYGSPPPK